MVPREVIDDIRNRVDIVRLIGERVQLKKVGRNFSGLCPFHSEKTPSFTVSDQKQLYHCFGCGEGGTAITFLMKYDRLTFPEALEKLAPVAGVDLSQFNSEDSKDLVRRREEKRKLYKVLAYAREIYHRAFMESDAAKGARAYAESRGISSECAKRLKLGYAPPAWDALSQALTRDGQSLADAATAGLIARRSRGDGYYDIFRGRLLFPIEDSEGRTIGFGGRVVDEGMPKYLNSPQTPVFDKGKTLYGLAHAKDAAREAKVLMVVEGYMDCVTLWEAGIENVVATLGTALTEYHGRLLKKLSDEIVLLFDGDAAGIKASRRAVRVLLPEGSKVRVALIPQGFDPDSLLRKKGKEAIHEVVKNGSAMLPFFLQRYYHDVADVNQKAEAIEELSVMIRGASNAYLREALLEEATKISGIEKSVLRGEKTLPRSAPAPKSTRALDSTRKEASEVPKEEMMLLRLAAEIPEARMRLFEEHVLDRFSSRLIADHAVVWLSRIDEGESSPSAVVDAWDDDRTRPRLAAAFLENLGEEATAWSRAWTDCTAKLRTRLAKRLVEAVRDAEKCGDAEELGRLQRELQGIRREDKSVQR